MNVANNPMAYENSCATEAWLIWGTRIYRYNIFVFLSLYLFPILARFEYGQ